jgi:hypothetical protein
MSKDRYSLSRFIKTLINRGIPTGVEMQRSMEIERSLGSLKKNSRGYSYRVAAEAFNPGARAVSAGGSGGALIGLKTEQLSGVLGWSAVVKVVLNSSAPSKTARSASIAIKIFQTQRGKRKARRSPPLTFPSLARP